MLGVESIPQTNIIDLNKIFAKQSNLMKYQNSIREAQLMNNYGKKINFTLFTQSKRKNSALPQSKSLRKGLIGIKSNANLANINQNFGQYNQGIGFLIQQPRMFSSKNLLQLTNHDISELNERSQKHNHNEIYYQSNEKKVQRPSTADKTRQYKKNYLNYINEYIQDSKNPFQKNLNKIQKRPSTVKLQEKEIISQQSTKAISDADDTNQENKVYDENIEAPKHILLYFQRQRTYKLGTISSENKKKGTSSLNTYSHEKNQLENLADHLIKQKEEEFNFVNKKQLENDSKEIKRKTNLKIIEHFSKKNRPLTAISSNNQFKYKQQQNITSNQKENQPLISKKTDLFSCKPISYNYLQNNVMKTIGLVNQFQNVNPTLTTKNQNPSNTQTNFFKQNPHQKELQFENYHIGPVIGQGSYAIVRLASHKRDSCLKKCAIKTYQKSKLYDPQKRKNVSREIKILERIRHPNIIRLIETIDLSNSINLVFEYASTTSLHSYLKSKPGRRLEEKETKILFRQIVDAINYCHHHNVVHRDIKLENLLIVQDKFTKQSKDIKVIDFGFSICMSIDRKLSVFCGTPSYMAPEIVAKKEYVGQHVDVWALGILLFVMLCGQFPFRGQDDKALYGRILKGKYEIPNYCTNGAKNLIKGILKINGSERLTTDQILKDHWLNS